MYYSIAARSLPPLAQKTNMMKFLLCLMILIVAITGQTIAPFFKEESESVENVATLRANYNSEEHSENLALSKSELQIS